MKKDLNQELNDELTQRAIIGMVKLLATNGLHGDARARQ